MVWRFTPEALPDWQYDHTRNVNYVENVELGIQATTDKYNNVEINTWDTQSAES